MCRQGFGSGNEYQKTMLAYTMDQVKGHYQQKESILDTGNGENQKQDTHD